MLEALSTFARDRLEAWTLSLTRPDLPARLAAARPPPNEYGFDPFGFSLDFTLAGSAPLLWLHRRYFRTQCFGLEQLPSGGVLLVSNHSGQLPLDGVMIGAALLADAEPPRAVRAMVERWLPTLPYVSVVFSRMGQVLGTPENARRLLAAGETLLVFPEGVRGLNKPWPQRYQLADFGTGFVRLALETGTPIVPVAVIGAEEQLPALANLEPLARLLRMPAFPLPATLLPLPLPARYRIHFGEPMRLERADPGDEDALAREARRIRSTIQSMIARGLAARRRVFW